MNILQKQQLIGVHTYKTRLAMQVSHLLKLLTIRGSQIKIFERDAREKNRATNVCTKVDV